MSTARDAVLAGIRRSLGRGSLDHAAAAAIDARLAQPVTRLIPARSQVEAAERVSLFQDRAEAVGATVARLEGPAAVPMAIADYLARLNLPAEVVAAPDPELKALPWSQAPMLAVRFAAPGKDDATTLSRAFCGIAETGTLMLLAGPDSPATASFLPENNIVVTAERRIVGALEHAWAELRQGEPAMPRAINLVTGPSRTADIAQQLVRGAHGPRRLHILVVGDG